MSPADGASQSSGRGDGRDAADESDLFCFDFSSEDFPIDPADDSPVVVVSVIGKTALDGDWTKGVPLQELLSDQIPVPENWLEADGSGRASPLADIRGIYDKTEKLICLTLRTPATDTELLGRLGEDARREFHEKGFLRSWTTVNAEFHRAMLFLMSVSHIVILSERGSSFDASWLRIFLTLNGIRERSKRKISAVLNEFAGTIPDDWVDNGRLCSPRLLFYLPGETELPLVPEFCVEDSSLHRNPSLRSLHRDASFHSLASCHPDPSVFSLLSSPQDPSLALGREDPSKFSLASNRDPSIVPLPSGHQDLSFRSVASSRGSRTTDEVKQRSLLRRTEILEDQIYKIFRKARVITNATSNSLFALPVRGRFVFVDTRKRVGGYRCVAGALPPSSLCRDRGALGAAHGWCQLADLMRNCDSPVSGLSGGNSRDLRDSPFREPDSVTCNYSDLGAVADFWMDDDGSSQFGTMSSASSVKCSPATISTSSVSLGGSPSSAPSFRDFVFSHVGVALTEGFDDSVGRHTQPGFFVLPRAGVWARIATELFAFLFGDPSGESDGDEVIREVIVDAVDTEMQFSESRCERVLPLAVAAYQEGLPPHYNEIVHSARLRMAENVMIGQRTGPLCVKYLRELRKECTNIWKSGRQMCAAVSLRGNSCINPLHQLNRSSNPAQNWLPVMPHSSGYKFISTCDCGRKQATRDDPFNVYEANYTFFARLAEICCERRCEYYPLPRRLRFPLGNDPDHPLADEEKDGTRVVRGSSQRKAIPGPDAVGSTDELDERASRGAGASLQVADDESPDSRGSLSQLSNGSAAALDIVESRQRRAAGKTTVPVDSPKNPLTPSDTSRMLRNASNPSSEELDDEDEDDEGTEEIFQKLRLEDDEEHSGSRRRVGDEPHGTKSVADPTSAAPLVGIDASHWALISHGSSSIYSHNCGIQDQPNFSSWSNFLMPWNVKVKVTDREKWMRVTDALNRQQSLWTGKKHHRDYIDHGEAKIKVFVGMEYECSKGHRFMAASPNRILRASNCMEKGGNIRDTGKDIVEQDMPLYMNCSCRSEPISVAQLMRIHVVTPKSPVRVALCPRVRPGPDVPEVPVFHVGGYCNVYSPAAAGSPVQSLHSTPIPPPILLMPSKYWILRLPYSYVAAVGVARPGQQEPMQRLRCFYPPKDGINPSMRYGALLKGSLTVTEPIYD